ncbi:MAG: ABC transporter ATP-binding protein [Deltaproteobacteria bacterium]|nr:ABC transporter ATP-binding protein [Deltaproteobacteria bacterium]
MVLQVSDIDVYYGSAHVLQSVSFEVRQGETVALLGRNGMGKTTTLRSIMGLTPPSNGSIRFEGEEIGKLTPNTIAKRGVSYIPDDLRIFPDLTCEENLEIARRVSKRSGYWTTERVEALFPLLADRRKQKGSSFSGGEKKMLSLARSLMMNPTLVLLDEPSEGLAPLIVRKLLETIQDIKKHGVTILMADQNLRFCKEVCDRGYILEKGTVVHSGTMEGIWSSEDIVKRYLVL